MGLADILNIDTKFKYIILTLIITGVLYLVTGINKLILVSAFVIVGIYVYFQRSTKENYVEMNNPYQQSGYSYDKLFKEEQSPDKINDSAINSKLFNNWSKLYWDRNWDIKGSSQTGFSSEPNKSVEFAEWCYGLKPDTGKGEYENSIRIKDTCKSGSIYMNTPGMSKEDRITCLGSW